MPEKVETQPPAQPPAKAQPPKKSPSSSSSLSSSSSSSEPAKVLPKPTPVVPAKPAAPAKKESSSSSDSSSSTSSSSAPKKPAAPAQPAPPPAPTTTVAPAAKPKAPSTSSDTSSDDSSSSSVAKAPAQQPPAAPKPILAPPPAQPAQKKESSSSSDSDSDSDSDSSSEEEAKETATKSPSITFAPQVTTIPSPNQEVPATPMPKVDTNKPKIQYTPHPSKGINLVNHSQVTETKKRKAEEAEENALKKQKTDRFQRIDPSKINIANEKLANNSYFAKGGESWGAKAATDLEKTRGDRFRHEKTKKKRGTYRGGAINTTGVFSIPLDDDSE
uniref:Srp40 C-terminal domain-containing protein n=1 Tax=Arcella intermedia TaxID=1963864 RepID=A0A6B2L771_9EUKA